MNYLIVATTWLFIGVALSSIVFCLKVDKDRFKYIKQMENLIKRNEELIWSNRSLIQFNSRILEQVRELKAEVEYLSSLFRN